MIVSQQAVEDSVCQRRVGDIIVPVGNWDLRSDEHRLFSISVFKHLQDGQTGVLVKRSYAEVVEDDQVHTFQMVEEFWEGAVEFGTQDFVDKTVHVEVQDTVSHQAGLMAEGAGEEGLAASGGAGDEDIFGTLDPCTVHQWHDVVFGEVTGGVIIELFEGSRVAEFAQAQIELDFGVVSMEVLCIGQRSDEGVRIGVLMSGQLQHGAIMSCHAAEAQVVKLIECGLWIHAVGC